jgi:hypothetical protein
VNRRVLLGCECSGRVRDEFAKLGWDAWSADILLSESPDSGTQGRGSSRHYRGDVRDLFSWYHPVNRKRAQEADAAECALGESLPLWDLAILFPPCTHLSQAGAVWWKRKDAARGGDGRMQEGAAFFMEMTEAPAPLVAVENPVGVMGRKPDPENGRSVGYRPPDQVVEPFWFGDPLRKKTCLWLKGLPLLTADQPVEPTGRVATGGGSWRTDQKHGRGANNGHEDSAGRKNRQRERNRTLPGLARAMSEQWTKFVEEQEKAA